MQGDLLIPWQLYNPAFGFLSMGSDSLRKGKSPFVEQHSCSCSYWRSFVIAREENKMTYNTMLARSFSWHEQRKLGSWALLVPWSLLWQFSLFSNLTCPAIHQSVSFYTYKRFMLDSDMFILSEYSLFVYLDILGLQFVNPLTQYTPHLLTRC